MIGLLCVALLPLAGATEKPSRTAQKHASAKSAKRVAHHSSGKKTSKSKKSKRSSWRSRGQRGIQPDRVRAIQSALIREKYLSGEPTGVWDQRTKEAMARFQSDNGWQSKVLPDSRALIKLGLGPDHSNLINPETAATGPIPGGGTAPALPNREH